MLVIEFCVDSNLHGPKNVLAREQRIFGRRENEKKQFGQKSIGDVNGLDVARPATRGIRADARYVAEKQI